MPENRNARTIQGRWLVIVLVIVIIVIVGLAAYLLIRNFPGNAQGS
ncbi:MAG TPA: hypothetical protein VFW83_00845 [Bryobacteraceae bacterium]|nr:hypothetical protein [Bryobacteraceae bacterium]